MRLSEGLRNGLLLLIAVVGSNVALVSGTSVASEPYCSPSFPASSSEARPDGRAGCARGARELDIYSRIRKEQEDEEALRRFVFCGGGTDPGIHRELDGTPLSALRAAVGRGPPPVSAEGPAPWGEDEIMPFSPLR